MPILMGRKTFESIGKALPGRKSIVITRNNEWKHPDVATVRSIEEAVALAKSFDVKEIFVIGGGEIFKTSLDKANCIYLTRIHHRFEGDVYFPELSNTEWEVVKKVDCKKDEKNLYDHTFEVWERKM